jgi:hypothetical protein
VLCAYTGAATCDRPVRRVPSTTLTVSPATAEVRPGGTVTVDATFTLPAGGPLTDVTVQAQPPTGWSATGAAVRADTLRPGQRLSGTWKLTAPSGVPAGYVDLPVVATYRFSGDPGSPGVPGARTVHVEQVVRVFVPPPNPANGAAVSDLPFLTESNGYGPVERDRSNGEAQAGDGAALSIGGGTFAKGIGMHANGEVTVWLGAACTTLTGQVGVDDEVTEPGSVDFQVLDGTRVLATSGVVRSGDGARSLTADVTGVRVLTLRVTDAGDGINFDHGDWANPRLTCR